MSENEGKEWVGCTGILTVSDQEGELAVGPHLNLIPSEAGLG